MGTEERAAWGVPVAHGDVRRAARIWVPVRISPGVPGGMVSDRWMPRARTLDRTPAKPGLDQRCFLPSQRRGQRDLSDCRSRGSNFPGWVQFARVTILKGLRQSAQGCDEGATLGQTPEESFNPERVVTGVREL